jgi:hypothetical protein
VSGGEDWITVITWGLRHAVVDTHWLPSKVLSTHDTREVAQAAADQLNTRRTAPQHAQQDALFTDQEGAA